MTNPFFDELSDVKAETRDCSKCGLTKPIEEFAYRGYNKNGSRQYKHYCVSCDYNESKKVKKFKEQHPYDELNHKCKCCGKTKQEILEELKRKSSGGSIMKNKTIWTYDHDHDTGEFRGIICFPCNTILGSARESIKNLLNAIKYMVRHRLLRLFRI